MDQGKSGRIREFHFGFPVGTLKMHIFYMLLFLNYRCVCSKYIHPNDLCDTYCREHVMPAISLAVDLTSGAASLTVYDPVTQQTSNVVSI